jgi:uncharacterized protein (TIGR02246 family)
MTQDQKLAVQALYDELVGAVTAADPDAYADCFAEDAVLMPPNAPVVQGRQAIREWAKWLFGVYRLEISSFVMSAQVIGDRAAFSRYEATGRYVGLSGGNDSHFEQKYLDALVCLPDGSWKVAAHMWSSNAKGTSIWS